MKIINKKRYGRFIILFIVLLFLSFFVYICLLFHPKTQGRKLIEEYDPYLEVLSDLNELMKDNPAILN